MMSTATVPQESERRKRTKSKEKRNKRLKVTAPAGTVSAHYLSSSSNPIRTSIAPRYLLHAFEMDLETNE